MAPAAMTMVFGIQTQTHAGIVSLAANSTGAWNFLALRLHSLLTGKRVFTAGRTFPDRKFSKDGFLGVWDSLSVSSPGRTTAQWHGRPGSTPTLTPARLHAMTPGSSVPTLVSSASRRSTYSLGTRTRVRCRLRPRECSTSCCCAGSMPMLQTRHFTCRGAQRLAHIPSVARGSAHDCPCTLARAVTPHRAMRQQVSLARRMLGLVPVAAWEALVSAVRGHGVGRRQVSWAQ